MKFIKTGLFLVPLVLALAGCSSAPQQPAAREGSAATVAVTAPGSPLLPPGEPTPNPYLQNQPSVSARAQQLFASAIAAMDEQQWAQAKNLLQRLTREYPELSGPWLNLGLVYRAEGDTASAEQAFTQALTVNGKNLDAYNQLAILKRESGDFAGAEKLYLQALAIWPFHPDSHRNIGILYDLYMGKGELALQHYQVYQQLLPEPDRQVNGWIVDLERSLAAETGDQT